MSAGRVGTQSVGSRQQGGIGAGQRPKLVYWLQLASQRMFQEAYSDRTRSHSQPRKAAKDQSESEFISQRLFQEGLFRYVALRWGQAIINKDGCKKPA